MDESVAVYRSLLEHPIWTQCDPSVLKVFMAALLLSSKTERQTFWKGAEIMVPVGSFIGSQEFLSSKCGVSRQTLRTCLLTLERMGTLTSEATNQYTLYTVANYADYQSYKNWINQSNAGQSTNGPTSQPAKQPTDSKAEKSKTLDEWFETFWSGYWNKVGKQAARKAWPSALIHVHKEAGLKGAAARDFLIAKLAAQRELVDDNTAPVGLGELHCSTWLNGQRWNDEVKPIHRSKQEALWDKV